MSLSRAQKCLTVAASLLGLLELDRDSFRLEKTCEIITSKMYLLLKKEQGLGCSVPLAKCLGILRFFSAHSSSNFPLMWNFTPSRFSDYLLVCLSVLCMLWGLCPHSHYQIHVTAGQMNLLYIFFQIGLSIHLEGTRKHHIKSQEPNFKSRSYVADFRFRQIKFHYFFPCKFPIVSFISLSSRENLLEVGTGNFLASSLSLQNKCVFFFFK